MSGNSLRSHPDLHNDEKVGDNRWPTCGTEKTTGRLVITTADRHRRMPYLKNLVGQVAPQTLPDLIKNSLDETLSLFYDQTGRFVGQRQHLTLKRHFPTTSCQKRLANGLYEPFVFQPPNAVDVDSQYLGDAKFGLNTLGASRKR